MLKRAVVSTVVKDACLKVRNTLFDVTEHRRSGDSIVDILRLEVRQIRHLILVDLLAEMSAKGGNIRNIYHRTCTNHLLAPRVALKTVSSFRFGCSTRVV